MQPRLPVALAIALLPAVLVPRHAAAQEAQTSRSTLIVQAADVESGQPLVGASVRIPNLGRAATAKTMGEARIRYLPGGVQHIEARMLGYQPIDIDVVLTGSDSLEVLLLMHRQPQLLPGVHVVGRMAPERLAEFERRRGMGVGYFLDGQALAKEVGHDPAVVFALRFPGLRLFTDPNNPAMLAIEATRPCGNLDPACRCIPAVYLDGTPLYDDLGAIAIDQLAGAEWYAGESAPIQYRHPGFACGTLLLWSRV